MHAGGIKPNRSNDLTSPGSMVGKQEGPPGEDCPGRRGRQRDALPAAIVMQTNRQHEGSEDPGKDHADSNSSEPCATHYRARHSRCDGQGRLVEVSVPLGHW